MTCAVADASTREWTADFRRKAAQARRPISAALELTRRCNLRCAHCYLGDQAEQYRQGTRERGTEAVKVALTNWAEAGCLYLLITGGDPMIRSDFADLYRHARELGMVVTVFCNGTRVTAGIVALFRELPPRKVEISLYGATADTHDAVTGVPGSHALAWAGIRRLQEGGIRVGLKTLLLRTNLHEFEAMEKQAAEAGVAFRHDAALFPRLADGAREPLALRVSPAEAVRCDMASPARRRMWREKIEKTAAHPVDERLYTCSAGQTFFHADPFGNLSPCLMASGYRCAAGDRPFGAQWQELAGIRGRRRTRPGGSFSGELRGACAHCPAFNALETGDEEQESEYMIQTTRLRYQAAMTTPAGDDP